jgi:hypothetical protein
VTAITPHLGKLVHTHARGSSSSVYVISAALHPPPNALQRRPPSPTTMSDDLRSFHETLLRSNRILAVCGAGLSASSGIPTFRGAGGVRPLASCPAPARANGRKHTDVAQTQRTGARDPRSIPQRPWASVAGVCPRPRSRSPTITPGIVLLSAPPQSAQRGAERGTLRVSRAGAETAAPGVFDADAKCRRAERGGGTSQPASVA